MPQSAPMQHTFLWHDYETFGTNPRSDRPAQFAAIRTDADLNEIGVPINILCQPAPDYLPDAQSCLITGITPQACHAQGLPEHQFAAQIHAAFSQPDTIGVGYNSIRFDDEFTRFLLWRNLFEPYGREWQNGCARWDLLDVVRLCHALRPDGINWPKNEAGHTSFRLEHLSAANGLAHEAAHDALSDVRATIALARLVKNAQPKLWEFALQLRSKQRVAEVLSWPTSPQLAQPFLHVSSMIPAEYGCIAVMLPLAQHPSNKNEVIAWDLRQDPRQLASLNAEDIRLRLFSKTEALAELGQARLPIKTIHLNKSPMVVAQLKTLSAAQAQTWQIDMAQSLQYAEHARALPDMSAIWQAVYTRPDSGDELPDVDGDLYGGFLSNGDRRKLDHLRSLQGDALHSARTAFEDERLEELFFRYRARNFLQGMAAADQARWFAHCLARLQAGQDGARSVAALHAQIEQLQEENPSEAQQAILEDLYSYADELVYSLESWQEQLQGLL
ncbi:MAG: exodeoxyribonuclease I [Brachymonas sp.]